MPLTAAQRAARARLAALKRHHGDQADLPADAAEIEQTALDRHIEELVARVPTQVTWRPAPEDRAALQRLLRLLFGAGGGSDDS